jgi:hypothetical protein
MSKSTIVKGKTTSGISFTIDSRVKDDVRLLYYLTKAKKEDVPSIDKAEAVMSMLGLIFGDNLEIFIGEVAKRHDGIADVESLIQEITEIFDTIKLKN